MTNMREVESMLIAVEDAKLELGIMTLCIKNKL